jgi:small GTP-binding protein
MISPVEQYSLKVILVGSTGVGKTNLVNSYFKHLFDRNTLATVAPSSCSTSIRVGNMQVELQIWDTAGQDRFQSISKMFYRESTVAFVCYDETRIDSIDTWVGNVREESPDCLIFLVTTKSDLLSANEVGKMLVIGEEKRVELKAKCHILTSAVTGDGVEPLFIEAAKMAKEIYKSNTPVVEMGQPREKQGGCC